MQDVKFSSKLAADSGSILSYVEHLERQLAENPPAAKRDRTRERLKLAAARVLSEKGYLELRALDVTEAAGLSEGSFYVYFRDKAHVAVEVLRSFLDDFVQLNLPRQATAFEAIRWSNRRWISICRVNAGLMRCLLQLGDVEPEFARLVQRSNYEWHLKIARSVLRRHDSNPPTLQGATLAAYMLGGMMDELVRKLVIYPDAALDRLTKDLGADDTVLADIASLLWFRGLYPGEPVPEDLGLASELLASS